MERYYIVIPDEFYDEMSCLDDAEYGSLIRAGQRYAIAGEPSEVTGNARFFLKRMCNTVDHYVKKMEETSARRSAAGKKGGRPKKQIKQEKNKEKIKMKTKKKMKNKNKKKEKKNQVSPPLSQRLRHIAKRPGYSSMRQSFLITILLVAGSSTVR